MEKEEKPVKRAMAELVNVKKEAVSAVVAPIKKEKKKAQPQKKQPVKEVAKKEEVVVKKETKEPKKEVAKKKEKVVDYVGEKSSYTKKEKKQDQRPNVKVTKLLHQAWVIKNIMLIY